MERLNTVNLLVLTSLDQLLLILEKMFFTKAILKRRSNVLSLPFTKSSVVTTLLLLNEAVADRKQLLKGKPQYQ